MAVRCASCGEELLGAVNRCWRCGTKIEFRPGEQDLPPVRRSPIRLIVDAALADEAGDLPLAAAVDAARGAATDVRAGAEPAATGHGESQPAGPAAPVRRVGSPFAPQVQPGGAAPAGPAALAPPVRRPFYPPRGPTTAVGLAALALGVFSVLLSFFTVMCLFTAVAGLLLGVWGLYAPRRGPAILGILLCCTALAAGGFNAVVWFFELKYGFKPWEVGPPI
jgi:hypothetical protein